MPSRIARIGLLALLVATVAVAGGPPGAPEDDEHRASVTTTALCSTASPASWGSPAPSSSQRRSPTTHGFGRWHRDGGPRRPAGPALSDLRAIRRYVARDKPAAAKALPERIRSSVLRLRALPEAGRVVPELRAPGLRESIVAPHRIVYEVRTHEVVIVRVWHGRRELTRGDLNPR